MNDNGPTALDPDAAKKMAISVGLVAPGDPFTSQHWDFVLRIADYCASIGDEYSIEAEDRNVAMKSGHDSVWARAWST